jgi:hypothetical protein
MKGKNHPLGTRTAQTILDNKGTQRSIFRCLLMTTVTTAAGMKTEDEEESGKGTMREILSLPLRDPVAARDTA